MVLDADMDEEVEEDLQLEIPEVVMVAEGVGQAQGTLVVVAVTAIQHVSVLMALMLRIQPGHSAVTNGTNSAMPVTHMLLKSAND
jgi:hypothetical protein